MEGRAGQSHPAMSESRFLQVVYYAAFAAFRCIKYYNCVCYLEVLIIQVLIMAVCCASMVKEMQAHLAGNVVMFFCNLW